MTRVVLLVVAVALLCWTAATSLTLVKPGERAVVRRFGRVLPNKPGPGLYCGLPWGLERVDRVPVGEARRVSVGFTGKEDDEAVTPAGQLLTGDHNLINVQAEISYRVNEENVEQFALNADRVDPLLARLAIAALTEWIAGHDVDRVLASRKKSKR
jgi:modulator of FtsH protease HflK